MQKPLLFISHITEEKELALKFKELISDAFLGMIEVFVSSDDSSITMGQRWLDTITENLKKADVEIVICSPQSVTRPWINFEAGAGWIRDIPVIPICHSGMEPSKLPMPMNLLQAAKASEISSLKLVFPVLANALNAGSPSIDFDKFVKEVKDFEERYTYWDQVNHTFSLLHQLPFNIIETLRSGSQVAISLSEQDMHIIEQICQFLSLHQLLSFQRNGGMSLGGDGVKLTGTLTPMPKLAELFTDKKFKHH